MMSLPRFLLVTCLLLVVAASPRAQEGDIEALIEQGRSSASNRELRAQASAEPPKTDDKYDLCIFYHKRGMANHGLGNYPQAIADLRRALDNNQPNRLTPLAWGDRWKIQSDLDAAMKAGEYWIADLELLSGMAREYQNQGIDYLTRHFYSVQLRLTEAYSQLGRFSEAENALKVANETLPRLRGMQLWATERFDLLALNGQFNASFLELQGKYNEAEHVRRLTLDYKEKNLAMKNSIYRAGHQFRRTAATGLANSKVHLADVLATRGKYGEAEFYARSGLDDGLAMYDFSTSRVSYALAVLGWTKFQQGELVQAQRFYQYAIAAQQGSGVPPQSTQLATRRAELANVLAVQSRWSDVLALFDERDRALRSDPSQFERIGSDHETWALALIKSGAPHRAAEMTERMIGLQLKRTVPNKYFVAQLRGAHALAQAALFNSNEALQAFQEAIPEFVRRDQDYGGSENSGVWRAFWRRTILEGFIHLLGKLSVTNAVPANLDLADEAFKIADIARDSAVQEAISATAARAQLPDGDLAGLARKDQDAQNRIEALNRVLGRLVNASEAERLNKIIADVLAEIERLRTDHTAFTAEIRKRFPEYAELIDPNPVGLAEVRKVLAPGEALVAIYLGDVQAYVWTIGHEGKSSFRVIPVARAEVEVDVAKLRGAVDLGDGILAKLPVFDLGIAHKLYKMFLAPDEALWKDAKVLNVIPDGALRQLPFSLLITQSAANPPASGAQDSYRDAAWLARKVAIAQLPSANALVALRRAPPAKANRQAFAGFGNPLFSAGAATAATQRGVVRNLNIRKAPDTIEDRLNVAAKGGPVRDSKLAKESAAAFRDTFSLLSPLPDTAEELKEIATALKADLNRDVFLGREASERNVKQTKLDNRQIVAFATHGVAPGELTGLDQPALVLSNPALSGDTDNDGFLTMEEVLGLKLDADWVVLSACNTASADGRGSEAVSGLGRAFFYAGARSLLVSNWAVETSSARLLTTELFRRQSENPQLSRAEALRQSMLSLMEKNATDTAGRATFSYAHPAFWAPFSLVGDGAR